MVWPFKWNLFSSTFTWYYLFWRILRKRNLGFVLNFDFKQSWEWKSFPLNKHQGPDSNTPLKLWMVCLSCNYHDLGLSQSNLRSSNRPRVILKSRLDWKYLQLSIIRLHFWTSVGNFCRYMRHDATTNNLKQKNGIFYHSYSVNQLQIKDFWK